ncbi:MAG: translocation/assembly module TamB domain-containing protein [Sphingobacteriales bacterium]|nr:translocation/assembly module TamB domain-containing protein [Sphingobacteriales bacterium]
MLLLITAVYIFIQTPWGQNWIVKQVSNRLSKDLQTHISIKHVDFSLFDRMHLEGILVEDRKGDTLLYAGDLKVKITDWFFFKKNIDLKYIGLDDAVVKFQRTDSVWRQQFIFDYFSSPAGTATAKKKSGIQLNLKKAELRNVTFIKKDAWLGEDMTIKVGALTLDASNLTLTGNRYEIRSLLLKDPVVALFSYPKLKPTRPAAASPGKPDSNAAWNQALTVFKIADLKIINGSFRTDRQTERQPFDYFDGQHIFFSGINANLNNSTITGDTVFARLQLSASERSGLQVKNLSADLKMTPQGMAFSNLDLSTNNSHLRHYFSMSYRDMSEMGDFIHKVKMAAQFDDSNVDSDDIAFFAPGLANWKKKISLKGKIRGTVDDLVGKEMVLEAGNSTLLNGDITLTGLPDINQTFIDFKANDFRTVYGDAVQIVPALRRISNPDLQKIQYLNFSGSFTGFINDFVTYGTIRTNLGTIRSDLNMKLPAGQDPVYSGSIASDNFRLGEFLGDKNIGLVSLTGTVKGKGFSEKTRNTLVDGTIQYAEYKNYRYNNIGIKGRLNQKLFDGTASINDENVKLDLSGVIDFNSKTPRFNLLADVERAYLKNLHLSKDSIDFRGKLNLNFASSTIDNFRGEARITEAEIRKDGVRLPFDSLIVTSEYTDGEKVLNAVSNEFTVSAKGDFGLLELPDAFTYFLSRYYPAYIKAPARLPRNQDIRFDIYTYYVDEYVKIFVPGLTGLDNSHIEGSLNLARNELNFTADVPQLHYQQYTFDNVKFNATGNYDSLVLTGKTNNIQINDSLSIPSAEFSVNARNDSSVVSVHAGDKQHAERANLNALVMTYNDGVRIDLARSYFTINGKMWTIDEGGELVFRKNNPAHGDLVLTEGEQKILLKTRPSDIGDWSDLKIELAHVNLNDLAPFFLPNNRLEGLVSGSLLVEDPGGHLRISSDDMATKFLRLDNDSIGELRASVLYDSKDNELKINGSTVNQDSFLGYDVDLFFGDPEKALKNTIALKARTFPIKVLERFLGTLFSEMQGFLTGDIDISGPFNNLGVSGKGRLTNAGLRVNFTQCFYKIQDTDIELTKEKIDLDGLVLIDTVTRNPIYISGGIDHESFRNMFYDLDISTRKPGTKGDQFNKAVQVLNTTFNDNKQFYGNVKGTGVLQLRGPQSEMVMTINANASEKDSSYITLPPSSSRESGIADFLIERKYGREMNESDIAKNETSIVYDVEVTANPMVTVKVVLDELTGDEIKGKGSGTLNIRSGTSEPLTLRGRFDIEEGNYLFTFQSFFKKPFDIRKGSQNYIEWNGDPYDANIKFEATYKADKVSFAPLASSLNLTSNISNARGDVYVVATLTDKLFKPQINFALDFPTNSVAVTDPELALLVQQMQKNLNEINRQVTYLIVFNSFAPSELSGDVAGPNLGVSTISGMLLGVLSDQLNKLFGNLLKSDKYNINFNTSFYNRNLGNLVDAGKTALNLGSNVNFSIGRSFFNNRFIISTGVGFDAPLSQSGQTNIQQNILLLPDVTLEWLMNEKGTIRATFFYRENADYLTTSSNASTTKASRKGLSLSFRKDYDRLGDLFRRNKKVKAAPVNDPVKEPEKKAASQPVKEG